MSFQGGNGSSLQKCISLADAVAMPKAEWFQHHNLREPGAIHHHQNFGFLLSGTEGTTSLDSFQPHAMWRFMASFPT